MNELTSPRAAAVNLLLSIVEKAGGGKKASRSGSSQSYLPKVLAHVESMLQTYEQAKASAASMPAREAAAAVTPYARKKDGALLAIGSLSESLIKSSTYSAMLEPLLTSHVAPEFTSPFGHLRSKACWVASKFTSILDADAGTTYGTLLSNVINCLHDSELPVRAEALVCMKEFVEVIDEDRPDLMQKYVLPHLPVILNDFFQLILDVENDDLVQTLESVVEKSGEAMAPYAVQVLKHLASTLWRCMQAVEASNTSGTFVGADHEDADDGDADYGEDGQGSLMAAAGCMRAISTVLESVSTLPDLYAQVEDDLMPLLHRYISSHGSNYDIMEETLDILSYYTYFAPITHPLSERVWQCCDIMLTCLEERGKEGSEYDGWAFTYLANMLIPLDNFISRDVRRFCSAGWHERLLKLTRTLMLRGREDYHLFESDLYCCPKIISVLLQYAKNASPPGGGARMCELGTGAVGLLSEASFASVLEMIFDRLRVTTKKRTIDLLLVNFFDIVHYDVKATLLAMNAYASSRRLQCTDVLSGVLRLFIDAVASNEASGEAGGDDGDDDDEEEEEPTRRLWRRHEAKACIVGVLEIVVWTLGARRQPGAEGQLAGSIDLVGLQSASLILLETLKRDEEKVDGDEEEDDGDEEDDDEDDEDDEDDDDDDDEIEIEGASVRKLAAAARAARQFGDDDEGEDDDEDDDDDDDDDDDKYASPVALVDALSLFAQFAQSASTDVAMLLFPTPEARARVQALVQYAASPDRQSGGGGGASK